MTNSQHYDSSHEQQSQGSAENNSLCSNYREPSQHSLTNSQYSGLSNDQLSRSFVEDRSDSLGSRSKEPSHHSSTNSQHSQGSQQHISVGSLGNPAPSQHSQTTSQSSRVSNQLSRGSQSGHGITELSQHFLTSSHNSVLSNQLSQRENDSRSPRNKEPTQRSSSRSSYHSGSSRLRSNRSSSKLKLPRARSLQQSKFWPVQSPLPSVSGFPLWGIQLSGVLRAISYQQSQASPVMSLSRIRRNLLAPTGHTEEVPSCLRQPTSSHAIDPLLIPRQ